MFLQEIIIDGFKSYAQKTVVSGFDPQFNAITGLNGTGKSNILDSICFVLGIQNLAQVSSILKLLATFAHTIPHLISCRSELAIFKS